MSKKYKDNSKKSSSKHIKLKEKQITQRTSIWLLLPIIFILSFVPFITRLKTYQANLSSFPWFTYNDVYNDFFLYNKQTFFLIAVFTMAVIALYRAYNNRRSIVYSPILIPLAAYGGLAFLSSIASTYRSYSFKGIHEHFESIFVLLGYCLIVYYCLQIVKTEEDVRLIVNCFLVSIIVMSLLGLSQYLGRDFFASSIGRRLILPRSHWSTMDSLIFNFGENRVYLSFYNPNYVGTYSAIAISFLLILAILTNKRKWMIPIYILSAVGISISLIGSQSKTGLIGLAVSGIFSLIILSKYIAKYFYFSIPLLLLIISIITLYNKANDNILVNQVMRATIFNKSDPFLKDIITADDELIINYDENQLHLKYIMDDTFGSFIAEDSTRSTIDIEFDSSESNYLILDERFSGFRVGPAVYEDLQCFYVTIDNHIWYFSNDTQDQTYYHLNIYGKLDKIITAPHAILSGYEGYASGRGYIWSRTLPLLKKHIILGSGADTFMISFPQQDYVGLHNNGYGEQLMTKPHNLYLQVGVQTGLLSLIAFLIFYAMYFFSSIKLYIKGKYKSYYSQVGVAILVASVSYMVLGLANDSTITVAPIFWVLIGLGVTVNRLAKPLVEEEIAADKAIKEAKKVE